MLDSSPAVAVQAIIALGANLGEAAGTLHQAREAIDRLPATHVIRTSSLYVTEPIESSGPDYTNAVLIVQTRLPARQLLHALQDIEKRFGRVRPAGVINAPRTLDLDVLTYGDIVSSDPELVLPHPRMHLRAFVLAPLSEIAPDTEIHGQGRASELLETVRDQRIEKTNQGL